MSVVVCLCVGKCEIAYHMDRQAADPAHAKPGSAVWVEYVVVLAILRNAAVRADLNGFR